MPWVIVLIPVCCAHNRGIKFRKGTTVTAFEGEGDKVRSLPPACINLVWQVKACGHSLDMSLVRENKSSVS